MVWSLATFVFVWATDPTRATALDRVTGFAGTGDVLGRKARILACARSIANSSVPWRASLPAHVVRGGCDKLHTLVN
jgi:hypothetical protein